MEPSARIQPLHLGPGEGGNVAATIGGAVHGGVVEQDRHTVGGGAHVELDAVGAEGNGSR